MSSYKKVNGRKEKIVPRNISTCICSHVHTDARKNIKEFCLSTPINSENQMQSKQNDACVCVHALVCIFFHNTEN